jgi:xanthine dehydrogenase accessory factor
MMVETPEDIPHAWSKGCVPIMVDPAWRALQAMPADVCVDAILAKHNLGTTLKDASTVIGIGPGFVAGADVHMVVESNRGHDLGRIFHTGSAAPNTGEPGAIGGHTVKRVLRAPVDGRFENAVTIGAFVTEGQEIAQVGHTPVVAEISGVVRGFIHRGTHVTRGLKIGDIDPRGEPAYCDTISEKARAIAGSVLEAILACHLNPPVPQEWPATANEGVRAPCAKESARPEGKLH